MSSPLRRPLDNPSLGPIGTRARPEQGHTESGGIMSNEIDLDHDTRIIKRNIAKGLISRAAVEEIVSTLPDLADQAEYLDPGRPDPADLEEE